MNLYEFDKAKPFNRGKFFRSIVCTGTPCRMGFLGRTIVYPFVYEKIGKEEVKIYPEDLGVKAFMFSQNYSTGWETYIVGHVERISMGIPKTAEGEPLLKEHELRK